MRGVRTKPSEQPSNGNPHRGQGLYLPCPGSWQPPGGLLTGVALRAVKAARRRAPCAVCGRLVHFAATKPGARVLKVVRHLHPDRLAQHAQWDRDRPKLLRRKKITPEL